MKTYRESTNGPYVAWKPWHSQDLQDLGYPLHNISCQSAEFCDRMYPPAETAEVASFLYNHQHPADCSTAKFLIITKEWYGGLGASIHIKAWMFLIALSMDRVLIDAPDIKWAKTNSDNCREEDWTCYFAPMTHCKLPEGWANASEALKASHLTDGGGAPQFVQSPCQPYVAGSSVSASKSSVENLTIEHFRKKPSSWWMAHAAAYLARPNKRTLSVACTYWNCITANQTAQSRPMASMFVRSGDKWKEAAFHNTSDHMRALEEFVAVHPFLRPHQVYFGTDSADILKQAVVDYKDKWNLLWVGYHRTRRGFDQAEFNKGSRSVIELQMLMTLTDLIVALSADVFVGTLSSNQNRLIDELRKVHGKARIPYLTPEKALLSWP